MRIGAGDVRGPRRDQVAGQEFAYVRCFQGFFVYLWY